jgi:hypothetical protein
MTIELRHRCRRCRGKLLEPTDNLRRAFCTRFCFDTFYRSRCIVCEKDITKDPLTGKQRARLDQRKFCGRSCKAEAARFPLTFAWGGPPYGNSPSNARNAHEMGLKTAHKTDRPKHCSLRHWAWQSTVVCDVSGPGAIEAHALENAEGNRIAIVRASVGQPGSYYLSFPRGFPPPPLESLGRAKERAEGLALMAMSLEAVDAKLAAKVRRDNSQPHPMRPPFNRGLDAHVGNFKITESKIAGHLGPIPDFLRRAGVASRSDADLIVGDAQ